MRKRMTAFRYIALLIFVSACFSSDVRLVDPGNLTTDSGDVQKSNLLVTVEVDSGLANALGWTGARVPDAEVVVRRGPRDEDWDTLFTDQSGEADFGKLIPGQFQVWARRQLSQTEMTQAAQAGWDVRALGGGFRTAAGGKAAQINLGLSPDEPGSLVISEFAYRAASPPALHEEYNFGGFIEIYNNSDSTTYLDGMVIGNAWTLTRDYSPSWPCSEHAIYRVDPDGLWTLWFEAFPGSGNEYPIQPGEAVVVATDAIDHSALYPGLLDLTDADFEFFGPADVDNPSVPNMIDLSGLVMWGGHGLYFSSLEPVVFLARPVIREQLPSVRPHNQAPWFRIPTEKILDVATFRASQETIDESKECSRMVHFGFDHLEARFTERYPPEVTPKLSMQRYVLLDLAGRLILQDTRTTAADFWEAPFSPGRVP